MNAKEFSVEWNSLVERICQVMGSNVRELLEHSLPAKIVAVRRFLAGGSDWSRFALADLSTFVLANSSGEFRHRPGESIQDRLRTMSDFDQGGILGYGRELLTLCSMHDAKLDLEADAKEGKYNPYAGGDFNDEHMREVAARIKADEEAAAPYAEALEISYSGSAAGALVKNITVLGNWI